MIDRLSALAQIVRVEFGGWRAYFARQGIWHGIVWLAYAV